MHTPTEAPDSKIALAYYEWGCAQQAKVAAHEQLNVVLAYELLSSEKERRACLGSPLLLSAYKQANMELVTERDELRARLRAEEKRSEAFATRPLSFLLDAAKSKCSDLQRKLDMAVRVRESHKQR